MSSLCKKYRPKTFDEIKGQEMAVNILKSLLEYEKTNKETKQCFLLYGQYGTGKTSTARMLFKAFNCENNICNQCKSCISDTTSDLIEMDAGILGGVDNIRELINHTMYQPEFRKFRVFLIDEAHELTKDAFNALLKTIEEPLDHLKFIFVTTNLDKIPSMIISRCFTIPFSRIKTENIIGYLEYICNKESYNISINALEIIADFSNGSMRDAITALEAIIAANIKDEALGDYLRIFSTKNACFILDKIFSGQATKAVEIWRKFRDNGFTEKNFCSKINDILIDFYFLNQKQILKNQYIEDLYVKFNLPNDYILNAMSTIAFFTKHDFKNSAENIIITLAHLPNEVEFRKFFNENLL